MDFTSLENTFNQYASEGAGRIAKVTTYFGFRSRDFSTWEGVFYPAKDYSSEEAFAAAMGKAYAAAKEATGGQEPIRGVCFEMNKGDVLNKDTSEWPDVRQDIVIEWDRDEETGETLLNSLTIPSIKEQLEPSDLGKPTWMRLRFKTLDYVKSDGTEGNKTIAYVDEKFSSHEEALAAVGGEVVNVGGGNLSVTPPDGWTAEENGDGIPWEDWLSEVSNALVKERDARLKARGEDNDGSELNKVERLGAINSVAGTFGDYVPKEKIAEILDAVSEATPPW